MTTQISPATPTTAPVWTAYLFGLVGAAFFATKGVFVKLALIENIDVITMLAWRMLIGLPIFVFVGVMGYRNRKAKNPDFRLTLPMIFKAFFVGVFGYYFASILDYLGLQHVTVQFNRLIMLTYPFMVVLIGAIAFKRPVTRAMIAGLVVSYSGLAIIFTRDITLGQSGGNVALGAALVFGASLSYAIYQIIAKPLIDQMGARLFTSIAMTSACVLILGQFLFTHEVSQLVVSPRGFWIMLALGTIATTMPIYLIATSIGKIGSAPTAMMSNISPLVTIVLGVSVLGENFTIYHAIGAALVLAGVIGFSRSEYKATKTTSAPIAPPI